MMMAAAGVSGTFENAAVGGTPTVSSGTKVAQAWTEGVRFDFGSGNTTGWAKYDLGAGNDIVGTRYSITVASSSTQMPKNFTFQGSNNDSTWTTLDTQTGQVLGAPYVAYTEQIYEFANATSYRYYKLDVTLNGGGGTWLEWMWLKLGL
jgi:hypothetical protein|tara:strand:+ start:166 stop:612 length:447 start_codon:yes stop_codon:yes gene_type:complete